MKSESPILLTLLIIVFCCGIGRAQKCQIGCQSKIDALEGEVAALDRAFAQQVPYLEKFNLTPTQQDPSHSPSAEQVLPNYLNVLLVHVTLDQNRLLCCSRVRIQPLTRRVTLPIRPFFRLAVATPVIALLRQKWMCFSAYCGKMLPAKMFSV
jgi:hypothetical protein